MQALKPDGRPIVVGRRGAVKPRIPPGAGLGLGCWWARQFFLRPSYFARAEGLMPALPWNWLLLKMKWDNTFEKPTQLLLIIKLTKGICCQTEPWRPEEWHLHTDGSCDFHFWSCIQGTWPGHSPMLSQQGEYLVFLKIMYHDLKKIKRIILAIGTRISCREGTTLFRKIPL